MKNKQILTTEEQIGSSKVSINWNKSSKYNKQVSEQDSYNYSNKRLNLMIT